MIKDKKIIIVLSLVVIILAAVLIGACGCVCNGHITNDEENGAVLRINNYRGNSLLDKGMGMDRAY